MAAGAGRTWRRHCIRPVAALAALLAAAAGAAPPAPEVAARAWVLLEARTGTVLAAANAEQRLPPASLTKLMTAYVLFGDLRDGRLALAAPVAVSARAAARPGARMFLRAGENVPVAELLQGMLVQSGNDATAALVEHAGPGHERFVARMNAAAAALGLADTRFTNASGLHGVDHYSSAHDLARLAAALRHGFPQYAGWFAQREFAYAGIRQANRNPLLGLPGVDGLKTGYTRSAGYCLVASAARDGLELVAVTLGSDDEAARSRAGRVLLDYGFSHFRTRRVHAAGVALLRARVDDGTQADVGLGLAHDLLLTLPNAQFAALHSTASVPPRLRAPLARGSALGELRVTVAGRPVADAPLIALEPVATAGLARRALDRLRRWSDGEARAAP